MNVRSNFCHLKEGHCGRRIGPGYILRSDAQPTCGEVCAGTDGVAGTVLDGKVVGDPKDRRKCAPWIAYEIESLCCQRKALALILVWPAQASAVAG